MMANDSQEYCLRWNKHVTNFAESFLTLLQNETLVDVSLLAEGKQFKAHKIVLSICSTYFQDAFKDLRDKHPIVILKDVKSDHLKALLDYMYKGHVNVAQEELDYFLKTAQSLGIKGFQEGLEDNGDAHSAIPLSYLRPKPIEHHRKHRSPPVAIPASTPLDTKPILRHIPSMYSVPPTSVNSVLSTALTMPSSLGNLASPISLNHLPQLSPSLVSTLASTFSHSLPNPMLASPFATPHHILPSMNSEGCDSPQNKRRRKHRRASGGTMDSGDSDGRSSGSPGDSAVPNLVLPRIPAKIIPVEDLRRNSHSSHQLNRPSQSHQADQQPKDLSIHASQKYSSNHNDHAQQRSLLRPPSLVKTPTSMPSFLSIDARIKPQDEPENLEHRPSPPFSLLHSSGGHQRFIKTDPLLPEDNNDRCNSSHTSLNSHERRSEDRSNDQSDDHRSELPRSPSKHSSDPESIVSPSKENFPNRHDDSSSDKDYSDDDMDENENSNGARERYSDFTPGPSSSRPQSEDIPPANAHGYNLSWPYHEPSSTDEAVNIAENSSQGFLKAFNNAINLSRLNSFLPPQLSPDLLSTRPPSALEMSLLLNQQQQHHHHLQQQQQQQRSGRERKGGFNALEPGPNKWGCEKCGRAYASTGNLKRHKKYECGVEPQFSCPVCQKKFQHRHSVKIHVYSTHKCGTTGHNEEGRGDATNESTGILSTETVSAAVPSAHRDDYYPLPQDASTAAGSNQEG